MEKKLKGLEREVNSLDGGTLEVRLNPKSANFTELKRLIDMKIKQESVIELTRYTPRDFVLY